jgi:thiol-disulfide isomerase/thioredoxin
MGRRERAGPDDRKRRRQRAAPTRGFHDVSLFGKLRAETHLPGFEGATGWLNSEPLSPDALRGSVVLVDFWTYTCINWLRTLGYVRAWHERYVDQGLVVIGVHTPEFPFEHDADNVRTAAEDQRVEYPIALDPDYAVWHAFDNNYWPAVYIADGEGRIRHNHFGEGGYEECEMAIQMLLREAGHDDVGRDLVSVEAEGFEAQADWTTLGSPETYLGYEQGQNFVSANVAEFDEPQDFGVPDLLERNQWALSGNWTLGPGASVLNEADGRLVFRFHARDVNLVMAPPATGPVQFRVLVDGEPPGDSHGLDIDEAGNGELDRPRLYQLIREPASITDRTIEIVFLAPGAEAYCFTFG